VPAYGVLSAIAKDQLYWLGTRGFVFTSPWVVTARTVRHPAVVLLSARRRPFELELNGRTEKCDAVAIAPHTVRGLRAIDAALVSVNVEVHHPRYSVFGDIPAPGVARLDREAFRALDEPLERAYEGALSRVEAAGLLEGVVSRAVAQLPNGRCRDLRADPLREFLREHPTCSLDDVARELRVSYARASRLFSRAVGMPLRTYQHWLKCMRAAEQFGLAATWTEIAQEAGFTDHPHFARTWQRSFGHPPSYMRDRRHVRVVA
jgi:AraC-like DNA-binding protein